MKEVIKRMDTSVREFDKEAVNVERVMSCIAKWHIRLSTCAICQYDDDISTVVYEQTWYKVRTFFSELIYSFQTKQELQLNYDILIPYCA